jgi:hypothetical protein
MSSTLQIVDTDLNSVLFDLYDPTAANSSEYGNVQTYMLHNPSWGVPAQRFDRFKAPGARAGRTTFTDVDLTTCAIPIRIKATSYDNLTKAVGRLSQLLSEGCIIKWVPDGSTDPARYADIEPTDAPAILDGRPQALYEVLRLFDTPKGITLALVRQPWFRGAKLDPALQALSASTLTRDSNDDGLPDSWAWDSATNISAEVIHAATESFSFAVATGSVRNLQQATGAATAAPGDIWSLAFDAASPSVGSQCQAVIEFLSAASSVLATHTGTLTTLTSGFQRLSVVTTAAPASTDRVRANLRVDNADATSRTIRFHNAMLEKSASPSLFRVKSATVQMDPALTGFAKVLPLYNPGSAPSPCVLEFAPLESGSGVSRILCALRSDESIPGRRSLTDYLNGPFYAQAEATGNNWTVTLGTNTTATAIGAAASGSGSDVARIAHTSSPTVYAKRITWTRTVDLDSLRGDTDVYARVKAGAARDFRLQLRWGPGGTALNSLPEVVHDVSSFGSFDWILIKLGTIRLPLETTVTLGTLILEVWTRQNSGTAQNLDVDYLQFVPGEQQALIAISGEAGTTMTLGKDLVTPVANPAGGTAGGVSVNTLAFDATTDNAGWGSNTGDITAAGRYQVSFALKTGPSSQTIVVRIRNITDSSDTVSKTLTGNGSLMTTDLSFDAVAGKAYQPQVDDPSGANEWDVRSISVTQVPVVTQNERLRTDPGSVPSRYAVEKVSSSGTLVETAAGDVVPFWLPPGLSLLVLDSGDATASPYVGAISVLDRTFTVTPTVYPRWWV